MELVSYKEIFKFWNISNCKINSKCNLFVVINAACVVCELDTERLLQKYGHLTGYNNNSQAFIIIYTVIQLYFHLQ